MEQPQLLSVILSCWGGVWLYMEVIGLECQEGDWANHGKQTLLFAFRILE